MNQPACISLSQHRRLAIQAHTRWTRPSDGQTLHRCEVCWPQAHPDDNGFVPEGEPIPHAADCPLRDRF